MPRPLRRPLAAGLTALLATGGVMLGAAPAMAGTATWSGTLEVGDPLRESTYNCAPYGERLPSEYDAQSFSVTETGSYDITMTAMTDGADLDYHLFEGGYDVANPLAGCIAYNDDRGSLRPGLTVPLTAGVQYVLLVEHLVGYRAGTTVQHTNGFSGPGDIVFADSPSVTIDQAATQVDPAAAAPVAFDVVFSAPVTGFDASDVVIGGTAGGSGVTVSGSGAAYVVQVGAVENDGSIEASIPAGAAISVSAGLSSLVATSTDASVTVATSPSVVVAQAEGQADPTPTLPITFEVQFSDFVTGLEPADVTLSGTAGSTTVQLVALDAPPAPEPTDPEPTEEPAPSIPPSFEPVAAGAAIGDPIADPEAYASRYLVRVLDAAQGGTVEVAIAAGAATTELGAPSLASTAADAVVTYVVAAPSPSPSAPAPTTAAPAPSAPAPTTAPVAGGTLPETGAEPGWMLALAAMLLVAVGAVAARRSARVTR